MSYLEQLYALRDAMIARLTANAGVASYGLDGESWSALPLGDLTALQELILMEENRVPGRRRAAHGARPEALRMAVTVDPSLNYNLVLAPTETVTYLRKTAQGTFAAGVAVTEAKRRALTKEPGEVVGKSVTWHLWQERLTAAGVPEPRRGDIIEVSAGEGYVIGMVEVQSLRQRFRLSTLRRAGE